MAYCTECGFKHPDNAGFCPNCGNRLKASESAAESSHEASENTGADYSGGGNASESFGRQDTGFYGGGYTRFGADADSNNSHQGIYKKDSSYYEKSGSPKTAIIVIASVLVLLVAAIVLIFQYASGVEEAPDTPPVAAVSAPVPEPTQNLPAAGSNTIAGSGYVEERLYYISFIGAEQFTDVDNQPAIRIYYEFTNYFEYPQSAWYSLSWAATQDGRELEYAYAWEDVEVYYFDTLNIRSNISIQCCLQFKFNPNGGKVDLTMFGWSSGVKGGTVSCTYVPESLPGAPMPHDFELFSDPQWTLALDSEGPFDEGEYYASVIDAELIEDYYGDPAVRVYYEFINYSSAPASMYDALYLFSYQDGVELFKTYARVDSETDNNLYTEIGNGETITVSCVFLLRNIDSNVEAEVEGSYTYDAVGQTFRLTP